MNLSRLPWYWHRLRAMGLSEMGARLRKKAYEFADTRSVPNWSLSLDKPGSFPKLPEPATAPTELREGLQRDRDDIMAGRWRAFGNLSIKVDDPPEWQKDYLAGNDYRTAIVGFKLDHRELPNGGDVKLIWELSRWQQIVRLAQAAVVFDDVRAAHKCVDWLEAWESQNPPYYGWNWTSGLEAGIRLIQFTWIDALLSSRGRVWALMGGLKRLRQNVLPIHAWFTWRHRALGSSANNHLLGELAGLIVSAARWPELSACSAKLDTLREIWEREVLAQFAEDGGNREQALNYHLFAWELCWQTRLALLASGQSIAPAVEERLNRAARFYWEVQVRREPWDYGDSDHGRVTPFYAQDQTCLPEWRDWVSQAGKTSSLQYWLGDAPCFSPRLGVGEPLHALSIKGWTIYRETGIAARECGFWWARWDLSPLGYSKLAAHAHLDAQHVSLWFKGVAVVIDPGTGAYYGVPALRSWLASRAAHNGPCPVGMDFPKRLGPFLWSEHHSVPTLESAPDGQGRPESLRSKFSVPAGAIFRAITRIAEGDGWQVDDSFEARPGFPANFTVLWQFAPGAWVKRQQERRFVLKRDSIEVLIEAGDEWAEVDLIEKESSSLPLQGIVSPAFRQAVFAPCLKLTARPGKNPCLFRTTFLASPPA